MSKMKVQMPSDAAFILNKLNEGGHEAYIVGGCVRDSILGRIPQILPLPPCRKKQRPSSTIPSTPASSTAPSPLFSTRKTTK